MLETLYSIVRLLLEWCYTQVHGVGDGVLGLPTLHAVFGDSATYLLDFYHLSEYLASASVVCVSLNLTFGLNSNSKRNGWQQVLTALRPNWNPLCH